MTEGHAETPPPPLLPAGVHVAHLLDAPLFGRPEAPRGEGDDVETPPTLPFGVPSASTAAASASHPAAPRLQNLSSLAESARAPGLEVSDEEELAGARAHVTTLSREGTAEGAVSSHAPRVENGGTSLRAPLLAPPFPLLEKGAVLVEKCLARILLLRVCMDLLLRRRILSGKEVWRVRCLERKLRRI